jgi:hypothetical protein
MIFGSLVPIILDANEMESRKKEMKSGEGDGKRVSLPLRLQVEKAEKECSLLFII